MGTRTIDLTADTFQGAVDKGGILLIDFWAAWCGPCRAFAPVFEQAAEKNQDITFAKVNTDEQQELAAAFEVRSIPTLAAFRDGILLFAEPGALPGPALDEVLTQIRAIDMDELRKKIAEHESGAPPAAND